MKACNVVSVNTADQGGGAEGIAWTLFKGFQERGLGSWLVVGDKKTSDPNVVPFFLSEHIDYRPYESRRHQLAQKWLKGLDRVLGLEDFHFPYSRYLLSITGQRPDVVVLHNLHGGYFDLRVLPELSHQVPVWLILHDMWSMTGHCAYDLNCGRWETGCGKCPHLDVPPRIMRDATHWNWQRKKAVFAASRVRVASSSSWLLQQAHKSILAPAIVESRLIPYGIDCDVFRPGSRVEARERLDIAQDVHMLICVAHYVRSSPFKDFPTLRASMAQLAGGVDGREVHCYVIGEAAPDERIGKVLIRSLPYCASPELLATYYRAADLFVHAARAEAYGIVILEAMACGLPVVASHVGGIPEAMGGHGLLVPPSDPVALSQRVRELLQDRERRASFAEAVSRSIRERNGRDRMLSDYLEWFEQVRNGLRERPASPEES